MLFELALVRGCTVEQVLRDTTSVELSHWYKLYNLHPFGHTQLSLLFGQLYATIINLVSKKQVTATDCLLWERPEKSATAGEALAWFKSQARRSRV